jgi:phosphatidylserine/phosphatidylglycerophosphate/cardiolipin synthase-like enzyme
MSFTRCVFPLFILVSGCSAAPAVDARSDDDGTDAAEVTEAAPATTSGAAPSIAGVRRSRRACEATAPRRTAVEMHVLPDDGEAPYVEMIDSATQSLRVFGYQMGYGGVLDALKARAQAGVDVRVILDGETQRDVNDKYRIQLEGAGAKFEWSDPQFSYMHAKTIVADGKRALVSTGNYSRSFMLKERNFAAALTEKQDVSDLAALFDADWDRTSPDLHCTRLLVSPVNSRDRLEALIASAQQDLMIESMQLGDTAIRKAVAERAAAGVNVRVLLAAPSWISANTSAGAYLTQRGISAKQLTSPAIHVKAIVVDGQRAYIGSENLSTTSLDRNREVGIIVTDAPSVDRVKSTFEADYALGTTF